jgi:DNA replication and repair protein RecF
VWDDLLVRDGAFLLAERWQAVTRLSPLAEAAHLTLSGGRDRLAMTYQCTALPDAATPPSDVAGLLRERLQASVRRDVALGQTTVGPHRDDVALLIHGAPAADYASRGQQRTVALSWRLAEAEYLRQAGTEPPVVLLDDVLSELDAHRRGAVMTAMTGFPQVFLTSTGTELSGDSLQPTATFHVERGELS